MLLTARGSALTPSLRVRSRRERLLPDRRDGIQTGKGESTRKNSLNGLFRLFGIIEDRRGRKGAGQFARRYPRNVDTYDLLILFLLF